MSFEFMRLCPKAIATHQLLIRYTHLKPHRGSLKKDEYKRYIMDTGKVTSERGNERECLWIKNAQLFSESSQVLVLESCITIWVMSAES